MNNDFGNTLNTLRKDRNLTMQELAKLADVSQPLISNLLNNRRVIGEYTARKLGKALQLSGNLLEDFVFQAINNCTEKVLNSSKGFPAELINLVTDELNALGIEPANIKHCIRHPGLDADAALYLRDGKSAFINVEIAVR